MAGVETCAQLKNYRYEIPHSSYCLHASRRSPFRTAWRDGSRRQSDLLELLELRQLQSHHHRLLPGLHIRFCRRRHPRRFTRFRFRYRDRRSHRCGPGSCQCRVGPQGARGISPRARRTSISLSHAHPVHRRGRGERHQLRPFRVGASHSGAARQLRSDQHRLCRRQRRPCAPARRTGRNHLRYLQPRHFARAQCHALGHVGLRTHQRLATGHHQRNPSRTGLPLSCRRAGTQ